MALREKINQQFNAALKNKEKTLVSTLRLIIAAIKDKDIANRSGEKKGELKDQIATPMTKGTKTLETLSTKRCIGAFDPCASITR